MHPETDYNRRAGGPSQIARRSDTGRLAPAGAICNVRSAREIPQSGRHFVNRARCSSIAQARSPEHDEQGRQHEHARQQTQSDPQTE
jgi:hypothetical protein